MSQLTKALGFCYRLRAPAEEPAGGLWVHAIVPLGLGLGLALAALTSLGWILWHLRGYGLWMAVLPMLLIYWLGPGTARLLGWAQSFAHLRRRERLGANAGALPSDWDSLGLYVLAILSAMLTFYFAIATLPPDRPTYGVLPGWLAVVLRPRKLYSAIVLMGVWGNASILLTSMLGRPAPQADPMVQQLLAAPPWVKMFWGWIVPTILSAGQFSGWWLGGWASAVALGVMMFGLMMLAGWLLARRGQGHCRQTLLAAALIGEIAFLMIFHALVNWPTA